MRSPTPSRRGRSTRTEYAQAWGSSLRLSPDIQATFCRSATLFVRLPARRDSSLLRVGDAVTQPESKRCAAVKSATASRWVLFQCVHGMATLDDVPRP